MNFFNFVQFESGQIFGDKGNIYILYFYINIYVIVASDEKLENIFKLFQPMINDNDSYCQPFSTSDKFFK